MAPGSKITGMKKEMTNQALKLFSWPMQLGIFWLASAFRYTVEPGGGIGSWWLLEFPIVEWRPDFLDWGPVPLVMALATIVYFSLLRLSDPERRTHDPGPAGILICMAGFALSSASNESFLFTVTGVWLCVIASIKFKKVPGYLNGLAAVFLIVACLLSAYMFSRNFLNAVEFFLIAGSITTGVCSTGFAEQAGKSNPAFMGAWFSLILFLSWSLFPKQPSIRTLVLIELSAAFIAGRHLYFSYIHQKSQLHDTDASEPDSERNA